MLDTEKQTRFFIFFLSKIEKKLGTAIVGQIGKWDTQVNFGGKFPDMTYMYENGHKILIFEHKAWAYLHENQLSNYKDFVIGKYTQSHIILITANSRQHTQDHDAAFCWSEIYEWIEEWGEKNESDFILVSFQNLLKHEGLGPSKAITQGSILYYFTVGDFHKRLQELVTRCNQRRTLQDFVKDDNMMFSTQENWGRLGIGNNNPEDWKPSIFVGFMLDGGNHELKPLVEHSPDFVILLSFHSRFHNYYPGNNNYRNLVAELNEKIPQIEGDWKFFHHLEDKSIENHNKWHPIYIRKPMLELFRGTVTSKGQDDAMDKAIKQIVPALWESEHLQKLKNELKTYK